MASPISRDDAITRIGILTQPDEFPEVASALVDALVDDAIRPDSEGRPTDDPDYVSTFDLNAAAASVFEVKAAFVANRYDTTTDGQDLSRSQLMAQFRSMASMYRMRITSTHRKQPPQTAEDRPSVEDFL